MIRLNLLPPQEKKEIEFLRFFRLIASLGIWLTVILIIFSLILVSAFFSLDLLLDSQQELIETRKQEEKNQSLAQIEERINQANSNISKIFLKQQGIILWTLILEELTEIIPEGLSLDLLSSSKESRKIKLNGFSPDRDKLLVFAESLKQSSYFQDIESPLSNLIKQKDIDFTLNFLIASTSAKIKD
jgi:Tfp pilus assembly protein PilN